MLRVLLLISDGTTQVSQQHVYTGYNSIDQMSNDVELFRKALQLPATIEDESKDIRYHKQEIDKHLEAIKRLKELPNED